MKLLRQYIGRTVMSSTLMMLWVFLGLMIFVALAAQLDDIGEGSYGVWQAFVYILLTTPQRLYSFFPLLGLVGALIGLGRLASSSELVVVRAAGVSILSIIGSVIRALLLFIVVITLVGETLAPRLEHYGEQYRALAVSSGRAVKTLRGLWVREGHNFIHVQALTKQNQLKGITRYEFNKAGELNTVSFAEEGTFQNKQWQFTNIAQSHFSKNQVTASHLDSASWPLKLNPSVLRVASVDPPELTLGQLHRAIQYQKKNHLQSSAYELAFWQRIFQPIATLVMIFLAIPFTLGPLRSVTMGLRLMVGIIVGFSFHTANAFFGPFSLVYQLPPPLAAGLPSVLFAGLGLWLTRRIG